MTATYLAQLSEARSIVAPPGQGDVGSILKSNMLFSGTMYVGATDLLCNEVLHEALHDKKSQFAEALLKPCGGREPLLRPVLYEHKSFTSLAEKILTDATETPMTKTPEKREQLLRHAESLDELGTMPKLANNAPFRPKYWESLNKALILLSRARDQQPVLSPLAEQIQRWLERLPTADVKDFRQSRVWRFIATLKCDEPSKRVLELVSDTEYQSMMASCSGAFLSKDIRFKSLYGKTPNPIPSSVPTGAPDHIEEIACAFPFSVIDKFNYLQVLELSRKEPFELLRHALSEIAAGRAPISSYKPLFDDCAKSMLELAKQPNTWQRRQLLDTWWADFEAAKNSRMLTRADIVVKAGSIFVAVVSGDLSWLLGTSALSLALGHAKNSAVTNQHKVRSANFIAAGEAYHTVLNDVEEWQRI